MNDYDGLTAAEREALEDEDLTLSEQEGEEADPDSDLDDADGTAEDAEDQDAAETEAVESVSSQSFSVPSADIDQIDASLKQLSDEREQLELDYESGDSDATYAEHRAKLRALDQSIQNLNIEKAEARAIQKMNQAYQLEWWTREVNAFKKEALREGIDYDKDEKMGAEWDRAVQFLGQDPNNAHQEARWFLQEAHEMVKARFRTAATRGNDGHGQKPSVEDAVANRRRRQGDPVPSLSRLPEAGAQDERESEFSHLDRLKGDALEKALARLSPDQQERYLTS